MQALMNFKSTSEEILLGNEDMQETIKDMFKTFHTNLLVLQQVIEVSQTSLGRLERCHGRFSVAAGAIARR